jgi:hypothetical protein
VELGLRTLVRLQMLGVRNAWEAAENDRRDHRYCLYGGQHATAVQ